MDRIMLSNRSTISYSGKSSEGVSIYAFTSKGKKRTELINRGDLDMRPGFAMYGIELMKAMDILDEMRDIK